MLQISYATGQTRIKKVSTIGLNETRYNTKYNNYYNTRYFQKLYHIQEIITNQVSFSH